MKRLSREIVEQCVEGDTTSEFAKEIWQFGSGIPLACVRKTRVEGPSKGPVVLVHGFAQNRYSWHTSRRSMVNWLALKGWDVYNLELRGHGRWQKLQA